MDDSAVPVGDKNEIRRSLGYVEIPEFANLRTSPQRLCPLSGSPKQSLPSKTEKLESGECWSHGTEGA